LDDSGLAHRMASIAQYPGLSQRDRAALINGVRGRISDNTNEKKLKWSALVDDFRTFLLGVA